MLKAAIPPIVARLDSIVSFSSFCQHDHQIDSNPTDLETNLTNAHSHVELLSLECGFEWLRLHYLEIFSFVVGMISEDQDEPLPLNWAILVEDWDHTYWLVWICIVRMLWARDSETFGLRHKNLNSWMISMNE